MPEFRSGLAVSILLTALAAIAVLSMAVDGRRDAGDGGDMSWFSGTLLDVAAPVQKVLAMPVNFVRDTWIEYIDLIRVREENAELRSRVATLSEESLQLREALVASGRLQSIALMRDKFETPMLPSELVGVDASPWFRSALLDRGQVHGVRAGMPVISEQGLVGLVRATSSTAARTMLLLDRQSALDGTVQRSRTRGIVRGLGSERLEFEFVARGHDVLEGDILMTSGLGGVYPKGLRIGTVVEVLSPDAQLMQRALISPSVDFGRLEQVFVMLRRGATMELLYASKDGDLSADQTGLVAERGPEP
jgi:rod shape-determining protein MreC